MGIPLLAKVPVDKDLPDWYKVGYRSKKPIKDLADSNLLKSPHSPNIAVTVLLDTPGIDLRFSILLESSSSWLSIRIWICSSTSSLCLTGLHLEYKALIS